MTERPAIVERNPRPAWSAVLAREPQALDLLCRQWLPVVLQWCRRLGGPRVDPDQACQEVFLVLLDRLNDVHSEEALPGFLFGVTRRVLARHRRVTWQQRWVPDVVLDAFGVDRTPEMDVSTATLVAAVQEIVAELPPEVAEVWVLCEVEGRTVPEAVDLLGVVEGTLRSRLRKARQMVRAKSIRRGLLDGEER